MVGSAVEQTSRTWAFESLPCSYVYWYKTRKTEKGSFLEIGELVSLKLDKGQRGYDIK